MIKWHIMYHGALPPSAQMTQMQKRLSSWAQSSQSMEMILLEAEETFLGWGSSSDDVQNAEALFYEYATNDVPESVLHLESWFVSSSFISHLPVDLEEP